MKTSEMPWRAAQLLKAAEVVSVRYPDTVREAVLAAAKPGVSGTRINAVEHTLHSFVPTDAWNTITADPQVRSTLKLDQLPPTEWSDDDGIAASLAIAATAALGDRRPRWAVAVDFAREGGVTDTSVARSLSSALSDLSIDRSVPGVRGLTRRPDALKDALTAAAEGTATLDVGER